MKLLWTATDLDGLLEIVFSKSTKSCRAIYEIDEARDGSEGIKTIFEHQLLLSDTYKRFALEE